MRKSTFILSLSLVAVAAALIATAATPSNAAPAANVQQWEYARLLFAPEPHPERAEAINPRVPHLPAVVISFSQPREDSIICLSLGQLYAKLGGKGEDASIVDVIDMLAGKGWELAIVCKDTPVPPGAEYWFKRPK